MQLDTSQSNVQFEFIEVSTTNETRSARRTQFSASVYGAGKLLVQRRHTEACEQASFENIPRIMLSPLLEAGALKKRDKDSVPE
jgi:hypothetical protein